MDDAERSRAAVRYDCMQWAMRSAAPGDDVMAILARAQLFADFVLSERVSPLVLNLEKPVVDER